MTGRSDKGEIGMEEGGGASRTTDPAAGTSSATDVSLREYLAQDIANSRREFRDSMAQLQKHIDELHDHQEEIFKQAMTGIDKRFDGVNEFRDALSDLSALMATKDMLARVEEKFGTNVDALSQRLTTLDKRMDLKEGQEAGSRLTKTGLYAAIGVAVALIGLLVVIANYLTTH